MIIGISKDAIAIINDRLDIFELVDMPVINVGKKSEIDINGIISLLKRQQISSYSRAYIEKAIPKQGTVSMFRYGQLYGIVYTILRCLGIPVTEIPPQVWKKKVMQGMEKGKGSSILRAEQLFKDFIPKRKKDHGKADALLIAYYGTM
jgi:crossover junction endodeoxyribonuclease RuvC